MENDIIKKQNKEENLIKLAAQNQVYSNAKKLMTIQVILSVPIVIVLSLLPIILSDSNLSSLHIKRDSLNLCITTYGILIAIIDQIFISPYITKIKGKAACIQENFDCEVLSLSWNAVKCSKIDTEEIIKNANEYIGKGKELNDFKDWYRPTTISTVPLSVGRIICQRMNCWWDSYLRRKFRRDVIGVTLVLFILLFLISLVGGFTVSKLITNVVFPFLPALLLSIRQSQANIKTIESLEDLKNKADEYWNKLLLNPTNYIMLDNLSRKLQDEIYENRKNGPLIFDWYYKKNRDSQHYDIDYSGKEMVNKYKSIMK